MKATAPERTIIELVWDSKCHALIDMHATSTPKKKKKKKSIWVLILETQINEHDEYYKIWSKTRTTFPGIS